MSLETELDDNKPKSNSVENFMITGAGLIGAGLGAIVSYNVAGAFATASDFSDNSDKWVTAGILSTGTIAGYKITSKLVNKTIKKIKRNIKRTKTLREISNDDEFLERQGIKRERLGITKSALKYLFTVPTGGALGYMPGAIGIWPLCVYFGEAYEWSSDASLDSGPIAGSIAGAYAFAEMTAKKQYERLFTTASALGGITATFYGIENSDLNINGLWTLLGLHALTGAAAGALGNLLYNLGKKGISKIKNYEIKIIPKEKDK